MVKVRVGLYNWFFPMINANETHYEQGFDVPSNHNPDHNPNKNPTINPN